jgi:putative NADH-flavin reductase
MRLLILGATGGTGSQLVHQALARGHHVTAYVRSPMKLSVAHIRYRAVTGDPRDAARIAWALPEHDAVLSALGSSSTKPSTLLVDCARSTVEAMRQVGVRRLMVVSTALAFSELSWFARQLKRHVLDNVVADSLAMERVVTDTDLEWLVVRPPRLLDGEITGEYRVLADRLPPGGSKIDRADVAHFMLGELGERAHLRQIVGVCR